jgi:peptidoglycan/xylan/chitin deacetylase (PgdA/CDA1 family)
MNRTKRPKRILFAIAALACVASLAASGCGGAKKSGMTRESVKTLLDKGIRPNEMGKVMVLEYHRIQDREGSYTRSIENFKKDLETLYQKGYRLVKFHDLMHGKIDVPAGTTPIVFSFDDSTEGQFRYLKQGGKTVLDPESALGMMSDFYKKHSDFGYSAIFSFLPNLFDQPKYIKQKLNYLYDQGFEFGNHTTTHLSLGLVSDDTVQKEIAGPVKEMRRIDPKVKLDVLCLPNGSEPKNKQLMFDGSFEGTKYHNNWALLVGSEPFYPMYQYKNPGNRIPRVQVMDYNPTSGSGADGSDYWLRYFDKHPELKFISDGDPNTICAPAYMENRLIPDKLPSGVTFLGY